LAPPSRLFIGRSRGGVNNNSNVDAGEDEYEMEDIESGLIENDDDQSLLPNRGH